MVVVPIMVQNGITNFVGMLDNIMVGQVGTEQMTGVAIGAIMAVFSGVFPLIYNTSDVIRDYATKFILVGLPACLCMHTYMRPTLQLGQVARQ